MRRAIALAFLVLGVVSVPAAHAERAVTITSPVAGAALDVHPHVDSLAGALTFKGRAARRATVEVRATCALATCRAWAVADRKGRWTARLDVVLDGERRRLGVRARSVTDPDLANSALESYGLRLPTWAIALPAAGPRLAVIGDSLAVGTDPGLRAALPTWRTTTDARVGRPLAEGMAMLAATPLPDEPMVLAFSLFTNDDPRNVAALDAAVRASVAALPQQGCVVWATIVRPRVAGVSYRAANDRLQALTLDPALQDRLVVVDWAAAVKGHRKWLRDDGVHPNATGYAVRSQLVANAAEACRLREGW